MAKRELDPYDVYVWTGAEWERANQRVLRSQFGALAWAKRRHFTTAWTIWPRQPDLPPPQRPPDNAMRFILTITIPEDAWTDPVRLAAVFDGITSALAAAEGITTEAARETLALELAFAAPSRRDNQ